MYVTAEIIHLTIYLKQ